MAVGDVLRRPDRPVVQRHAARFAPAPFGRRSRPCTRWRDLGAEPFAFTPTAIPFGANFAVRRSVQERYPYDLCLGLKPNGNLRGEETALILQMLKDGLVGQWVPGAQGAPLHPETPPDDEVRATHSGADTASTLPSRRIRERPPSYSAAPAGCARGPAGRTVVRLASLVPSTGGLDRGPHPRRHLSGQLFPEVRGRIDCPSRSLSP